MAPINSVPTQKRSRAACATRFNIRPKEGLRYYEENGYIPDGSPETIAELLLSAEHEGLSLKRVGIYLGGRDDQAQRCLTAFADRHDFVDKPIDDALRNFLGSFRLPGEAQQIDRIIQAFACSYYKQNPDDMIFANQDVPYVLAFSLVMLNTDLHNRQIKPEQKMTKDQFVRNNRGINDGSDLPSSYLEALYDRVKADEIRLSEGEMVESDVVTFMAPQHRGWLQLRVGGLQRWRKLWFVLNDYVLYSFDKQTDENPRTITPLDGCTAEAERHGGSHALRIFCLDGGKIQSVRPSTSRGSRLDTVQHIILRAPSRDELEPWLRVLSADAEGSSSYGNSGNEDNGAAGIGGREAESRRQRIETADFHREVQKKKKEKEARGVGRTNMLSRLGRSQSSRNNSAASRTSNVSQRSERSWFSSFDSSMSRSFTFGSLASFDRTDSISSIGERISATDEDDATLDDFPAATTAAATSTTDSERLVPGEAMARAGITDITSELTSVLRGRATVLSDCDTAEAAAAAAAAATNGELVTMGSHGSPMSSQPPAPPPETTPEESRALPQRQRYRQPPPLPTTLAASGSRATAMALSPLQHTAKKTEGEEQHSSGGDSSVPNEASAAKIAILSPYISSRKPFSNEIRGCAQLWACAPCADI